MASMGRLMAVGFSPAQAQMLGAETGSALVATGSTQATALLLANNNNFFGTVAASTGAVLPVAEGQSPFVVYNGGANALLVYPSGTQTINGLAASAGLSVPAGKSATFFPALLSWIANISA